MLQKAGVTLNCEIILYWNDQDGVCVAEVSLNNVKVAVDCRGQAMYSSREPIPTRRIGKRAAHVYREIGIYPLTAPPLRASVELEPTHYEIAESCDMLRLLEHGHRIRMVNTDVPRQSVDTPVDLARAEALMQEDDLFQGYGPGSAR